MPRYRKRPVEVDAVHYDGTNFDQVQAFMSRDGRVKEKHLPGPGRGMHPGIVIHTLEGDMTASVGDWIIRGVAGELYPCKPGVFEATYELVTEEPQR